MSSHREAPETSKDPVADNTDVYAFVSPTRPDTVTLIANFIPFQKPDGGPNFYEFGEDVLYEIHVTHSRSLRSDVTYQFRFRTEIRNKNSFLYNTGPITNIDDPTWNRPQYYTLTRVQEGHSQALARDLPCPPCNVGPRSTPHYDLLSAQAVQEVGPRRVFAGQRADAFHVDVGSVFDLGGLRPFNEAHLIPLPSMDGVNSLQGFNVHTIAIQVPIAEVTERRNRPTDPMSRDAVIGVWATASRQKSRMYDNHRGSYDSHGPWEQVSRLGNPLVNEVLIPMSLKDGWNSGEPRNDRRFQEYVERPELASLLPTLYPGVFPNLAAYTKPRADLAAILHTGIPEGVVPGFQNYTGPRPGDVLRLNVAIPPSNSPNDLGLIGGDLAGFPNGRRVNDDVTTIELRAIAGATIPLVDPSYTPDPAAAGVTDGTENTNAATSSDFPNLGLPGGGYQTQPGTTQAS
jgi:hypothetical protein